MLRIDGSAGEGGGQVLRTSLALSICTGTPIEVEKIRAGREKPGLLRQHLTAVQAAAAICGADVKGAELGSRALSFRPGGVRGGDYSFAVGSAGSACLVLQTILPPLLSAGGPTTLALEGGTHNPWSPPFDFLARTFLPALVRMGALVEARLDRPGFYPAGGGRFSVRIEPCAKLGRLEIVDRGEVRRTRARAVVSNIPKHVAEREIAVVRRMLGWAQADVAVEAIDDGRGPGNVLVLDVESDALTEVFTGFGEQGVRAEAVAEKVVRDVRRYLAAEAPVGPHLADQLLVPLALGEGGVLRTLAPTLHTTTNVEVIRRFVDARIEIAASARDDVRVSVAR